MVPPPELSVRACDARSKSADSYRAAGLGAQSHWRMRAFRVRICEAGRKPGGGRLVPCFPRLLPRFIRGSSAVRLYEAVKIAMTGQISPKIAMTKVIVPKIACGVISCLEALPRTSPFDGTRNTTPHARSYAMCSLPRIT
jgi:hypothetical protein